MAKRLIILSGSDNSGKSETLKFLVTKLGGKLTANYDDRYICKNTTSTIAICTGGDDVYAINENYIYNASEKDFLRNPNNNLRKLLFSNSELLILLRFSELFKKNIADKNGVQQIKSTVEYISSLSEKILKALKCNVTEEIDIEYLNLQSNTCTLELDNLIEKKKNLYMKGEYLSCNEI